MKKPKTTLERKNPATPRKPLRSSVEKKELNPTLVKVRRAFSPGGEAGNSTRDEGGRPNGLGCVMRYPARPTSCLAG